MSDRPLNWGQEGDWSSGMIPALGAGGREFDSRITPLFVVPQNDIVIAKDFWRSSEHNKKKKQPDAGLEPATSRLRACHSTD